MTDAIETGGTAMTTKRSSPALRELCSMGYIKRGMKVIDFGAGNGRNADWLRAHDVHTYAYDPYNGEDCDGWSGVTTRFPTQVADVLVSMFVLNVLTKADELDVLKQVKGLAPMQYHVVRNHDLMDALRIGIMDKQEPYISQFNDILFTNQTSGNAWLAQLKMYEDGYKTSRGFQRGVNLCADHTGFMVLRDMNGYKTYMGSLHTP